MLIQESGFDSLYEQLSYFEQRYGKYLKEQKIKKEVDCLKGWITSHKDGYVLCSQWLNEYGPEMLDEIKSKLKLALQEQQNTDYEFPNTTANESKCDELGSAIKLAHKAEIKFNQALNELYYNLQ